LHLTLTIDLEMQRVGYQRKLGSKTDTPRDTLAHGLAV